MKVLKPLPHAVIDYAMAGTMIAAPWLFGFRRNRTATINSVGSGLAILGLSLTTRYPLGAVGLVSFPTHGVVETAAAVANVAAPWLMGFSRNRSARWTHVMSGLGTLAVVAMTDYRAAQEQLGAGRDEAAEGVAETGSLASGAAAGRLSEGEGQTSTVAGGASPAASAMTARGAGGNA